MIILNYNFQEKEKLNYKELDTIDITKKELKYILDYERMHSLESEELLDKVCIYFGLKKKSNKHGAYFNTNYNTCAPYER